MTSVKPSENEDGLTRIEKRLARRRVNAEEARSAAKSTHKGDIPAVERVASAGQKLAGTNVSQAIAIIDGATSEEKDYLLLAEEAGANRVTVLRSFAAPRRAARERYEQPEGGIVVRDETPPPASASGELERE
jgi:hypothetical protein